MAKLENLWFSFVYKEKKYLTAENFGTNYKSVPQIRLSGSLCGSETIVTVKLWGLPCLKEILTMWQTMKVREFQKPYVHNSFANCEILEVQFKLIYKTFNSQLLSRIGKNWEAQVEQHSKIPIFNLFVNWEKLGSTA